MIIAAFNPKGGVGKTTTAVNVAAVLAGMRRKVLLVDLEAEMNAPIAVGVRPAECRPSVADALLNRFRPSESVRFVKAIRNLHLVTGSPALAEMDDSLRHARQRDRRHRSFGKAPAISTATREWWQSFGAGVLAAGHHHHLAGLVQRLRTLRTFRHDRANHAAQEVARRVHLAAARQGLSCVVRHDGILSSAGMIGTWPQQPVH